MTRQYVVTKVLLLVVASALLAGCGEASKPTPVEPGNAKPSAKQLAERLKASSGVKERVELLDQLGEMGSEAEVALPELILLLQAVDAERIIGAIARTLAKIGPAAVPPLIEVTKGVDPKGQQYALLALRTIGPVTPEVVPAITASLRSPSPEVRQTAAFQLHELGPIAKTAVPELVSATRDHDKQARDGARNALSRIAPDLFGGNPWAGVEGSWRDLLAGFSFGYEGNEPVVPEFRAALTKEHRDQLQHSGDLDPRSVTIDGTVARAQTLPRTMDMPCHVEFVKRDGKWLVAKITCGVLVLPIPKR